MLQLHVWISLCLLINFQFAQSELFGREQSTGAFGYLTCNERPAQRVLVKMYNKNVLLDDLIAKTYTDNTGFYELSGWSTELTEIDPTLNFYHNCNYDNPICKQKFRIHIPTQYISEGRVAKRLYDGGNISLDSTFPNQGVDCLHL